MMLDENEKDNDGIETGTPDEVANQIIAKYKEEFGDDVGILFGVLEFGDDV